MAVCRIVPVGAGFFGWHVQALVRGPFYYSIIDGNAFGGNTIDGVPSDPVRSGVVVLPPTHAF